MKICFIFAVTTYLLLGVSCSSAQGTKKPLEQRSKKTSQKRSEKIMQTFFKAIVVESKRVVLRNGVESPHEKVSSIVNKDDLKGDTLETKTSVILKVLSISKGSGVKVGEKLNVSWKDDVTAYHRKNENYSLNKKPWSWTLKDGKYKIIKENKLIKVIESKEN